MRKKKRSDAYNSLCGFLGELLFFCKMVGQTGECVHVYQGLALTACQVPTKAVLPFSAGQRRENISKGSWDKGK